MNPANTASSSQASVDRSLKARWKNCLKLIKEEIPWQTFETWFTPIIPVTYVDETLILRIPSRFFYEWIDSHYGDLLKKVVRKEFGLRARVEYSVVPSYADREPKTVETAQDVESTPSATGQPAAQLSSEELGLDPRFTFDAFFVSGNNELALKAAMHIAQQSSQPAYNPLFVFGKTGTGKTHLLHAIGHRIRERRKRCRIKLVTSEKFLNDYVNAVQNNQMNQLHKTYLNVDVLLLDDVQVLANKMRTQESLLFIVSELVKKRKQVVITSAASPAQLSQFEPRLISFFQRGLIVDLLPPEYDARRKIVAHYFEQHDIEPEPEIVEFLAAYLVDNMHLLYSALVRIIAQVSLLNKPISLEQTQFIVAQLFPHWNGVNGLSCRKKEGLEHIIEAVSEYFNIPVDVLRSRSRKREVVLARQIAMYLVRELTGESLARIGYHFSDVHHSSVLYAFRRIQTQMQQSPMLRTTVQQIRSKILEK
ncbi:MAG: chromosomal replication initiator protein DnaA [Calditrichaeota bacterium]|nr:MAG: chromosomal replication initiator protein DnaA [Calditrichota bacterium]